MAVVFILTIKKRLFICLSFLLTYAKIFVYWKFGEKAKTMVFCLKNAQAKLVFKKEINYSIKTACFANLCLRYALNCLT